MSTSGKFGSSLFKSSATSRYFQVDPGYDKRVYENTWGNWVKIFLAFGIFYTFNALYFWSNFILGINYSNDATMVFILIFIVSVIVRTNSKHIGNGPPDYLRTFCQQKEAPR
jgi:hypothetical protein